MPETKQDVDVKYNGIRRVANALTLPAIIASYASALVLGVAGLLYNTARHPCREHNFMHKETHIEARHQRDVSERSNELYLEALLAGCIGTGILMYRKNLKGMIQESREEELRKVA